MFLRHHSAYNIRVYSRQILDNHWNLLLRFAGEPPKRDALNALLEAVHDDSEQSRVGPALMDSLPAPYDVQLVSAGPGDVVGPFEIPGTGKFAVARVVAKREAGVYSADDPDVRDQIRAVLQQEKLLEEVIERPELNERELLLDGGGQLGTRLRPVRDGFHVFRPERRRARGLCRHRRRPRPPHLRRRATLAPGTLAAAREGGRSWAAGGSPWRGRHRSGRSCVQVSFSVSSGVTSDRPSRAYVIRRVSRRAGRSRRWRAPAPRRQCPADRCR